MVIWLYVLVGAVPVACAALVMYFKRADEPMRAAVSACLGVLAIAVAVYFGVQERADGAYAEARGPRRTSSAPATPPSADATTPFAPSVPPPSGTTSATTTDDAEPQNGQDGQGGGGEEEEAPPEGKTPTEHEGGSPKKHDAPDTTRVRIKGAEAPWTSMCLDVYGPLVEAGTPVQIWTCKDTSEMEWRLRGDGKIVGFGGNCLTVAGPETDATPVQMHPCGTQEGQTWERSGSELRTADGYCLDIQGPGTSSGTRVQIWGCERVPQQQWHLDALAP